MSHLLMVAFSDLGGADAVLHKLRTLGHDDLIDLEDACVAERDANGVLHLKQAISERIEDALHPRFWHRLIEHLLHHGEEHMPEEGKTPELGLDRAFAKQVAKSLAPGTSGLFLLVREAPVQVLAKAFEGHPGNVLRTSLPMGERQALTEALSPQPPRIPSADELREMVDHEEHEQEEKQAHEREAAEAERKRRLDRLKREPLKPAAIAAAVAKFVEAAHKGETGVLAYRFPTDLCTDRGRAINNLEPGWEDTLVGQPRQIYDYWRAHMRPLGYHLTAKVLNFPDGMPGDVGFIFTWGKPAHPDR